MNIFSETKKLVTKEKFYTAKILANLAIIDGDKLYCELGYPTLHKYIVGELGYSDPEARVRTGAVRLMRKSDEAAEKIAEGSLTLTNAAAANDAISSREKMGPPEEGFVARVLEEAAGTSTRGFQAFLDAEFRRERRETVVLKEYLLDKFDRLRRKYGDETLSTVDLIETLLEKELKSPCVQPATKQTSSPRSAGTQPPGRRHRAAAPMGSAAAGCGGKVSAPSKTAPTPRARRRYIGMDDRRRAYTDKCGNCGVRYNLEFDHILKFSHGGANTAHNLQILCRACNGRKEIRETASGFFG